MHLRDDRFSQVPHAEKAIDDVARPVAEAACGVEGLAAGNVGFQIVTGGKTLACTADDRDGDIGTVVRGLECVEHFTAKFV